MTRTADDGMPAGDLVNRNNCLYIVVQEQAANTLQHCALPWKGLLAEIFYLHIEAVLKFHIWKAAAS